MKTQVLYIKFRKLFPHPLIKLNFIYYKRNNEAEDPRMYEKENHYPTSCNLHHYLWKVTQITTSLIDIVYIDYINAVRLNYI